MKGNIKITVEKIRVDGRGVILLTGPSGCGKGEIGKALCQFLSIPEERHLSMGDILRKTVDKAKGDGSFNKILAEKYGISSKVSIFDKACNSSDTRNKAEEYLDAMKSFFRVEKEFVSQLDWLEFCVVNGLLIPDIWTEKIIDALLENSQELRDNIFILDGYPRTVTAAKKLLTTFERLEIPMIKVLHLFITKEQMRVRALNRGRIDDTQNSLESRYQFYVEKVQPCIDYLKDYLGTATVSLIDAHQPICMEDGKPNIEQSIQEVVLSAMESLGLPKYLLDIKRIDA